MSFNQTYQSHTINTHTHKYTHSYSYSHSSIYIIGVALSYCLMLFNSLVPYSLLSRNRHRHHHLVNTHPIQYLKTQASSLLSNPCKIYTNSFNTLFKYTLLILICSMSLIPSTLAQCRNPDLRKEWSQLTSSEQRQCN